MTEVFVAVIEDRHCDVEVQVFANEIDAVKWAADQIPEYADVIGDIDERDSELNEYMKRDGWVLNLTYSCEGDSVRVMKRELK